MAERWEIVIDFAAYQGQNLTIMNERDFQTYPDYPATDKIIRIVVGTTVIYVAGNSAIPAHLADLDLPAGRTTVDKTFKFERSNGHWLINGVGFEDVSNRVLAFPGQGKTQRWRLTNKSGGWSHPIHIHRVDCQVLSRVGSGRQGIEPNEAAALKDVVYLGRNEEELAHDAPWSGVYMVSKLLLIEVLVLTRQNFIATTWSMRMMI